MFHFISPCGPKTLLNRSSVLLSVFVQVPVVQSAKCHERLIVSSALDHGNDREWRKESSCLYCKRLVILSRSPRGTSKSRLIPETRFIHELWL